MKKFRSTNIAWISILFLALSMSIGSCSKDDNDDGVVSEGQKNLLQPPSPTLMR